MTAEQLEAELHRLEPLVRSVVGRFYLPGGDYEDLAQEARLGFLEALERWDGVRPVDGLARVCGRRRVVNAVRTATRQRRYASTAPLSLDATVDEYGTERHELIPAAHTMDELAESRAQLRAMVGASRRFSPLEREALAAALAGVPYWRAPAPVAKQLDNAAQRARRKLAAARTPFLVA